MCRMPSSSLQMPRLGVIIPPGRRIGDTQAPSTPRPVTASRTTVAIEAAGRSASVARTVFPPTTVTVLRPKKNRPSGDETPTWTAPAGSPVSSTEPVPPLHPAA